MYLLTTIIYIPLSIPFNTVLCFKFFSGGSTSTCVYSVELNTFISIFFFLIDGVGCVLSLTPLRNGC